MLSSQTTRSDIEDKIRNNETLSAEDVAYLYDIADINWLGGLSRMM